MHHGVRSFLSLVVLAAASAGCGPSYYLVTSRLAESSPAGSSSVAASATYPQVVSRLNKVAVRAPDRCAEQTAASATGAASTAGVILQTRCGVEMAELERTLTRAGFTVYSWRVISDMAVREKITPLVAARRMGAEVLFQVNSLERSTAQMSLRWKRSFFHSDPQGGQGTPAMLSEPRAQSFEEMVAADERARAGSNRLSVTIDVSAIWIETGETFWFYSWTNLQASKGVHEASALVACDDACSRVTLPKVASMTPGARAGGEQELAGGPADQENAIYYELLGQTIDDLVHKFAGNATRPISASASAAPVAPPAAPAPAPAPRPVPPPAAEAASLPASP